MDHASALALSNISNSSWSSGGISSRSDSGPDVMIVLLRRPPGAEILLVRERQTGRARARGGRLGLAEHAFEAHDHEEETDHLDWDRGQAGDTQPGAQAGRDELADRG